MEAGAIIAGKYQVERVLGEGGMGVVVSAFHRQLGQRVAIKMLLPSAVAVPEIVERFLREARAAVRLRSEHVGRVIDVGTLDGGAPYMVMEFLDGDDLSVVLTRHTALAVPIVVDYILQALSAIAEAHSLGIVHRDLKPANLFLTQRPDGSPWIKVLDFGIAKATTDLDLNLTRTTAVMGSPGYMSPEQLRSTRSADARSDIWALGVIMYELVSGVRPFAAESITELALKAAIDPTPPLNAGHVPPAFAEILYRCLEKHPQQRYQNAAELAAALAPFGPPSAYEAAAAIARVLGPAVRVALPTVRDQRATPPVGVAGAVPTTLTAGSAQVAAGPRGSRRTIAALGVTTIAIAAAFVVALLRTQAAATDGNVATDRSFAGRLAIPAGAPASTSSDAGVVDAAPTPDATPDTTPDATPPDAASPPDATVSSPAPPSRPSHRRPHSRGTGSGAPLASPAAGSATQPPDLEDNRF